MNKMIAGKSEMQEFELLIRAAALHRKLAEIYETHGMHQRADDERAKCSLLHLAMKTWKETWKLPGKKHAGHFKEKKSETVSRLSQILREHMGMSRKLATEIADALVRGNRGLSSDMAIQKGWDLDGTTIAVGCEKLKRMDIGQRYGRYIDMLDKFAFDLGIDADMYDQAIEFMNEDELEREAV